MKPLLLYAFEIIVIDDLDALFRAKDRFIDAFIFVSQPTEVSVVHLEFVNGLFMFGKFFNQRVMCNRHFKFSPYVALHVSFM